MAARRVMSERIRDQEQSPREHAPRHRRSGSGLSGPPMSHLALSGLALGIRRRRAPLPCPLSAVEWESRVRRVGVEEARACGVSLHGGN